MLTSKCGIDNRNGEDMKAIKLTIGVFISMILLFQSNISAQTIIDAVKAGTVSKVKELIEKNPQLVNTKDASGYTPLHIALNSSNSEMAKFLIDAGSDVNSKSNANETPLHIAAKWRINEIVALLLSKGANPNVNDASNYTPLTSSIRDFRVNLPATKSEVTVKLLLENGADINAIGMWNWRPIQVAAEFGSPETIALLIDKGAETPIEPGQDSYQLLNASCKNGINKLFDKLLEKGFNLQVNSYTGNLIHLAAAGGSEYIVEKLIEKGFKVMTGDGYGWSPLHCAAETGKFKVVKLLIKKGADINDRSASGKTPYNVAEFFGHKEVCDYLVSKGADKSDQQFPSLTGNYMGQKEPGKTAKVFAPDIVTIKYMIHGNLTFTPDGKEAFWSPWCPSKESPEERSQIFTSRLVNGKWSKPEIASFCKVGNDDDSPFVTPDGKKLFFVSRRPLQPGGKNSPKENIWYVTRNGNEWSNPHPLDAVNSLDMHWMMSADLKGNLYFSAAGPDRSNFSEIFISKFENGEYSKPEVLGRSINSENYDGSPYISPDGSYLLFDRASPAGIQQGLFISFRKDNGSWTEARPIAEIAKINGVNQCGRITPDGKYLFFLSSYGNEYGVFWMDAGFINEMRLTALK